MIYYPKFSFNTFLLFYEFRYKDCNGLITKLKYIYLLLLMSAYFNILPVADMLCE